MVPAFIDKSEVIPEGDIVDADDDSAVQPALCLPCPKTPSAAQVANHNITHMPYRSWCPHCVASRRPNSQHRSSSSESERSDPLLVADYCFLRSSDDTVLSTVLVARLYPSRAMLCTVVDAKGPEPNAVARLARFIRDSGYSKLVYRSDQEGTIRSLFEETFKAACREGVSRCPKLSQMVPEASAVGESQSNGAAENAVQKFEDLFRCYKSALETHLDAQIPIDKPVMKWLVEHTASIFNRYVCNPEGQTPYEALHGQRFKGKLAEFGERVFYYVPRRLRAKLNLRWRLGTFIGNSQATNEAFVAAGNGDVVKTRSIVRVVEANRWNKDAILGVLGTPHRFRPSQDRQDDAHVEEHADPHANLDREDELPADGEPSDAVERAPKALDIRITKADIERFGYSDDCPRCHDLESSGKSYRHHTDACRLRFYLQYKETNHPKWRAVKHLFDDKGDEKAKSDGQPPTPRSSPAKELFEQAPASPRHSNEPNSVLDQEEMQVDRAIAESMAEQEEDMAPSELNEADIADLFCDSPDSNMDDPDATMEGALLMAGVSKAKAKGVARAMLQGSPPSSFVEVYGKSIYDYSLMSRRNLNVEGLRSFDIRSLKPDGTPWDFCRRSDRKLARRLIAEADPDWVIGAPPCTAFSIWNHGINFKKMTPDAVRLKLEEGRLHLRFVCSLYRRQLARGKYFLHEHPASAMSWKEEDIASLARLPMTQTVTMHQCQYGLVTPSVDDPEQLLPALKPTKWLTNSSIMASLLSQKCDGSHQHQHLVGGRCKDASFYPVPIVKAILKGIERQRAFDQLLDDSNSRPLNAMPMLSGNSSPQTAFGPPHSSKVPKVGGGHLPITYEEANFKARYLDEYTGEVLEPSLIRTAIEDELDYFNSKVWEICTTEEMKSIPDYILVRSRWVLCNKGDSSSPDVRARLVSCELNNGEKNDFFSASTPPLEGKRMLFSRYVSERQRKGKPLRLSFVDIRKAYFNAIPERAIFMRVPKELGLPPNTVARQVRCVYGTRDAGKLWEDTYTQVLEGLGFTTGVSNPCVFHHPIRDIAIVVHGDDFTALGTDDDLNWYEGQLQQSFEIKIRGRLGEGCDGPQEIRILNRIVAVDADGLRYEADPRHGDLLSASLNLSSDSSAVTPGVKPVDRDANAVKSDEPNLPSLLDYSDPDRVITAILQGKFDREDRPHDTASRCGADMCDAGQAAPFDSRRGSLVCGGSTSFMSDSHDPIPSLASCFSLKSDSTSLFPARPQASRVTPDSWVLKGRDGTWVRMHSSTRRSLANPCECAEGDSDDYDQDSLSSLRYTCGTYADGRRFSFTDSWRNQEVTNAVLRQPWTGITCFFNRDCECMDTQINRLSSIHDVHMRQAKHVRFSLDNVEQFEVTPYSECLPLHPHLLVSTSSGWKRIPPRCDPFTGMSSTVMQSRRSELGRKFGRHESKRKRRRLLSSANRPVSMDVDSSPLDGAKRLDRNSSFPMEVDSNSSLPTFTPMDVSALRSMAVTKPVKSGKFQKRVGAKTAKKLELAENSAFELSPADATTYRALAARCNYLSQDRPDIAFSSKELCREFSVPNKMSFQKLKRLARYLSGLPRLVYRYSWQAMPEVLDVFVDTDFAGCQTTRRSTSGGVALIGQCLIKHWSKTQTTISLSSGEAELHGIAYGAAQALGLQSLLLDLGWKLRIRIHSDATAAIGICRRKGIGKIRHLATADLWIQDKIRSKTLELCKVLGTDNPADVLTKYVNRQSMDKAIAAMGLVPMSGRPASAPVAMGV